MIALAVGGRQPTCPRARRESVRRAGGLLVVVVRVKGEQHQQVDHGVRGQFAIGTARQQMVLGQDLVDHVARHRLGEHGKVDLLRQFRISAGALFHGQDRTAGPEASP